MKSTTCRVLAAALIAASGFSGTMARADKKPAHRPFYLGVSWNDNDPQAAKDLFFETGCNFVRLDGGGFDGEIPQHLKDLQNFKTHGIDAMVQMGSHWPDWTWDTHTEDYFVDDQDKSGALDSIHAVNYSGSQWPQFSYASPEYRNYLQGQFTHYLTQVGNNPNVVAIQMHNEPGYLWVDGRIFDYNPKAITAFRAWLPSQYSNISALNASWGTKFAGFDTVDPVKQRPPVSNIAAWMDWRRFNIQLIHDFLAWESDLGHKVCPGVQTTTNMPGPLDNWYAIRLSDNFKYSQPFDRASIDLYATQWTDQFDLGYGMDTTRGVAQGRPLTVAECGPFDPDGDKKLNEEQGADRLYADLWRFIGHGATAVSMWTLASAPGCRLTTGTYNPRLRMVREVAHLSKMLDLGDFSYSPSPVALVADTDSFLYYGGSMPNRDGDMRCQASIGGLYAALVQAGMQVDVIDADQVRAGVGSRYKALVLATSAIVDDKFANSLSTYIGHGGVVVAEEPFAQFDRWGKPEAKRNPLQRLFGVEETSPYKDGADNSIEKLGFAGKGRAEIKLTGATALASFADGAPAVTECRHGLGDAVLIASDAGAITPGSSPGGLANFLGSILQRAGGIVPRITTTTDGYIDASALHDASGNQLFIVTNAVNQVDPPPVHANVDIAIRSMSTTPGSQLFTIAQGTTVNGQTAAGPLLTPLPKASNSVTHVALHDFDSASAMLVAADHDPLLRIASPSAAAPGSPLTIKVVCYNPSPRPVTGALALVAPSGWQIAEVPHSVKIAPRGQADITLKAVASPTAGRSVVKAQFTWSGGSVLSVPVDVTVGAPG